MKASSTEYLRGAVAAAVELTGGESPEDLRVTDMTTGECDSFAAGFHDQIDQWPEPVESLPPYYLDLDHDGSNMACPVFIGIGVFCAFAIPAGWKHLSGPVVGVLGIVAVLAFISAWRNCKA